MGVRILDYAVDAQSVLDGFGAHVWQVFNGWSVLWPLLVSVGIMLSLLQRARQGV